MVNLINSVLQEREMRAKFREKRVRLMTTSEEARKIIKCVKEEMEKIGIAVDRAPSFGMDFRIFFYSTLQIELTQQRLVEILERNHIERSQKRKKELEFINQMLCKLLKQEFAIKMEIDKEEECQMEIEDEYVASMQGSRHMVRPDIERRIQLLKKITEWEKQEEDSTTLKELELTMLFKEFDSYEKLDRVFLSVLRRNKNRYLLALNTLEKELTVIFDAAETKFKKLYDEFE